MTHGNRAILLTSAALLSAACSSSPKDKYPSAQSFCDAKAEEECQAVAQKCEVTPDACRQSRSRSCAAHASETASAGRHYSPGLAQGCIDQVHSAWAKDFIPPVDQKKVDDMCERVFEGARESLQSCQSDYDCAGTRICDKGACATETKKKQGDQCGNAGDVCEAGFYCAQKGKFFVCDAKGGAGQRCAADLPACREDLRCDVTCQPRLTAGALCRVNDDCSAAAPFCDVNNNSGAKCGAGLHFAPEERELCKQYGGT